MIHRDPHASLAILCGGASRRLGTDKGLYAPDGREPLVVRALRRLSGIAAETLVVVRDAEQARRYEAACAGQALDVAAAGYKLYFVCDDATDAALPRATLTGVATALARATGDLVIVVPVDQIGVGAEHLTALLEASRREATSEPVRPTAFALDSREQGPLPFPSVWPRALATSVLEAVTDGRLGVATFLERAGVGLVPAGSAATVLQANGNTVAELCDFMKLDEKPPPQAGVAPSIHY